MTDFPLSPPDFSARVIHVSSFAHRFAQTGIAMDRTSAVWPVANLAIYQPFQLSEPMRLDRIIWFNGAAVNGNVDAGIYDAFGGGAAQNGVPGTRLISTGSIAQAGVNARQTPVLTDRRLPAGMYYFALALDNNVGQVIRVNDATLISFVNEIANTFEEAAAFPLPAVASAGTISSRDTPLMTSEFRHLDI